VQSNIFIEECAALTNGLNDDQVDAMTQALLRWHMVVPQDYYSQPYQISSRADHTLQGAVLCAHLALCSRFKNETPLASGPAQITPAPIRSTTAASVPMDVA